MAIQVKLTQFYTFMHELPIFQILKVNGESKSYYYLG